MKKEVSLVIIVIMIISVIQAGLFGITAGAVASGTTGDCTWSLNGTVLTISGNGNMDNYTHSNPSPWGRNITEVIIENGVTNVGYSAFYGCEGLKKVDIPNSVKKIEAVAFCGCNSITDIVIPNSVKRIENSAFLNCQSLVNISIPDTVSSIGYSAFSNTGYYNISKNWENNILYIGNHLIKCRDTKSEQCVIRDGILTIADDAFFDCNTLVNITMPRSIINIGMSSFEGCKKLSSIEIPETVKNIGKSAFKDCTGLNKVFIADIAKWCSVKFEDSASNPLVYAGNLYLNNQPIDNLEIPTGVTAIGNFAFEKCTNLKSIIIPDTVTSLGNYVFYGCRYLKNITIPESIKTIGKSAFRDCISLNGVYITDIVKWCNINFQKDYQGIYYKYYMSNPLSYADKLFLNNKLVTDLTISEGVSNIDDSLFRGYKHLKSVTVSNSVKSIDKYAFAGCSGIKNVYVSDSVTSIGEGAFFGCTSLANITVPFIGNKKDGNENNHFAYILGAETYSDKLSYPPSSLKVTVTGGKKFDENAFYNCDYITDIEIPDSITSIGKNAFAGCTKLDNVYIKDIAKWCSINFSNYSSNPLYYTKNLYLNNSLITDLIIPDGVTGIGNYAFVGCYLSSVTIPDSVTRIGNYAFKNCDNLLKVNIPENMKSIGIGAFSSCNNLDEVYITDIAKWCSIDFGGNPLHYANNLYLNGSLITDLIIPDGVTGINDYAFENCNSIINVTIPKSVVNIGKLAFSGCEILTNIDISDGVENIDESAFAYCVRLKKISIPASVKKIGKSAFEGCEGLNSVKYTGSCIERNNLEIESNNNYLLKAIWKYENTSPDKHVYTNSCDAFCNICGATRTITHRYKTEWSSDNSQHWHECSVCGNKKDVENHSYSNECDTTCNVCGYVRSAKAHVYDNDCDTTCNICGATRAISHRYKTEWSSDNSRHWHECSVCGNKKDVENHSYSNECDTTCNVCGYISYLPGDLDGDKKITDKDAIYLLMHSYFPDDYTVDQPLDYNNDGLINDKDAIYLLMHCYFPEDYPITK